MKRNFSTVKWKLTAASRVEPLRMLKLLDQKNLQALPKLKGSNVLRSAWKKGLGGFSTPKQFWSYYSNCDFCFPQQVEFWADSSPTILPSIARRSNFGLLAVWVVESSLQEGNACPFPHSWQNLARYYWDNGKRGTSRLGDIHTGYPTQVTKGNSKSDTTHFTFWTPRDPNGGA